MVEALSAIDAVVWGPVMIALLLGSHVFLTFKTGFIQRKLPQAIRLSWVGEKDAEGDISNFDVPQWLIGVVIVVFSGAVILGGVQKISGVCEKLVPIMAVGYVLGCVVILVMNASFIVPALQEIVVCAFSPRAAFGGAVGSGILVALQFGCARGLFSNESGLGSAPIIAAAAQTRNPARQALVAMTGTFWSMVVICLLTGIVLVSTMLAHPEIQAEILTNPTAFTGAKLSSIAFSKIPFVGTPILVLGMVAFSYSTILGWSYYGSRCAAYLFGKRGVRPYQIVYVLVAFLGAIGIGDSVWLVSDIGNALMAIPNIIVVLVLSGLVARETRHYVFDDNLDEESGDEIPTIMSK